jgi:hypothetical protein
MDKIYNISTSVPIETLYLLVRLHIGARGSVVVKALCYKLEGRGFDSR